jgi:hypothetical protein
MNFVTRAVPDPLSYVSPRYFNVITKTLIIAGTGLVTNPMWKGIVAAFFLRYGLKISDDFEPLYGLAIIFFALSYNLVSQTIIINNVDNYRSSPVRQVFECKSFDSYLKFCQSLVPILDENKYIFRTFGPNSGANDIGILRTDMTLWHESRSEIIVPNNNVIDCLINANVNLIPLESRKVFEKLQSHIYAFKKHVQNPEFDYGTYQFPQEIEKIVRNY